MRLLVVGAGATGGYFGGRLAQAGRDVTFLVRPQRAAKLAATGLKITEPDGSFAFSPRTLTRVEGQAPFDVILLTVKGFALEPVLESFAGAVGPGTMILSVLNGMRHVDKIAARFGSDSVVGCVCKIVATLDPEGNAVRMSPLHDLAYGERNGSVSERTQRLDAFFKNAGFDARLSPVIEREMWEKWVLLASLGAVTCLMRSPVGAIVAAPGGTQFIEATFDEVVAIVRAVGVAPSTTFLDTARSQLTAAGSGFASSMYRDLQKGSPVESDQIIGDLLERGRSASIAAPLLSAAYAHLSIYQAGLQH